MRRVFLGLVFACVLACPRPAPAILITSVSSASDLVSAIAGSGVTISNIVYTGVLSASGLFTGGLAAGLDFNSGIVLTSGAAANIAGTSNTADNITTDNGLAGSSALDALIPGYQTHDATVLGFDFVSTGSTAFFNYVFGSDEYDEWVGSAYNDVFGFFLDGTNIALIPSTTTPVSINNVNSGLNSAYYHDNDPSLFGIGTTPYAFEYDGFTKAFTASMTGLTAGQTYHIDLAIADAGDHILDSGVFIQAGTFSKDVTPTAPEPGSLLLLLGGLIPLGMRRLRTRA